MRSGRDLESLFDEARQLPPGEARDRFLRTAREGDEALFAELRALLRADARAGERRFLGVATAAVEQEEAEAQPCFGEGEIPSVLGRYELRASIGSGAQARVFRAHDLELDRSVAVKVLRPSGGFDGPTSLERFRREATVTAQLEHPNLCTIYETGTTGPWTWIAMQLVEGDTLAQRLELAGGDLSTVFGAAGDRGVVEPGRRRSGDGPVLDRLLCFFESTARALHAAHGLGLVHRDVKPANLMVTPDGQPVLLDFGIARGLDPESDLTRTAEALGTPHYLAPELLDGTVNEPDPRADVYALGVSLYECLSGSRPFDAPSLAALYQRILAGAPARLTRSEGGVDRDLETVVATAMARDPAHRYRSAEAFAEDLRRIREHQPILARPAPVWRRLARWSRRNRALAASLATVSLVLVAATAVSSSLLVETRAALSARDLALREGYDRLSEQAAIADLRTQDSWIQERLLREATRILDEESPGCTRSVNQAWRRVRNNYANLNGEASGFLDVVGSLRDGLSPQGRTALVDFVHPMLRYLVLVPGPTPRSANRTAAAAAGLARLALEDLAPGTDRDARILRARVALLDALILGGRPDMALRVGGEWQSAAAESLSDAQLVYDTRLGRARWELGDHDRGRAALLRSAWAVQELYPHSWFSNIALTNLLHDERIVGDVEQLRDQRARFRRVHALTPAFGHVPLQATRMLMAPEAQAAWALAESTYWERSAGLPVDADRCRSLVPDLRRSLHLDADDPRRSAFAEALWATATVGRSPQTEGQWRAARELLEFAVELVAGLPDLPYEPHARILKDLALTHHRAGSSQQAADMIAAAIRLCPLGSRPALEWRGLHGECLAYTGDLDRADRLIRSALAVSRRDLAAIQNTRFNLRRLRELGALRGDLGLVERAVDAGLEVETGTARQRSLTALLAVHRAQFGSSDRARDGLRAWRAEHGEHPDLQIAEAWVAFWSGDFDGALRSARPMLETRAEAHRIVARCLLRHGEPAAAVRHFEAGSPALASIDDMGLLSDHGLALHRSGRSDEAEALLDEQVRLRPDDPESWFERARFFLGSSAASADRASREAVRCAERASELCMGSRPHISWCLARARLQTGDEAAAREIAMELAERMGGREARWVRVAEVAALLD